LTAFALFKRQRDQRALEFDRAYKEHRADLETFWTNIRGEWARYVELHSDLPGDVGAFFSQVGPPPRVGVVRDWATEMVDKLSVHQQHAWGFVQRVYPPRRHHADAEVWKQSSIKPEGRAKSFHEARGALSWFWKVESLGVPARHFRVSHSDDRPLLALITWLDVALAQWTRAEGPGNVRVWRLAEIASRKWTRPR
jgi:hypothetical protein